MIFELMIHFILTLFLWLMSTPSSTGPCFLIETFIDNQFLTQLFMKRYQPFFSPVTHQHCRQLLPDKRLPCQQNFALEALHIFMASGGNVQPKFSVHKCRVCTFKMLLIISKTFGILKSKWHKMSKELPVSTLCTVWNHAAYSILSFDPVSQPTTVLN